MVGDVPVLRMTTLARASKEAASNFIVIISPLCVFSLSAVIKIFVICFVRPSDDGDDHDGDLSQIMNFKTKAENKKQRICRAQRLSDSDWQL